MEIDELLALFKPKKKTKKKAEILEERIIDTLPSDVEPGEEE